MIELRVMVGIPGSGKSSIAEHWLAMGEIDVIISSDAIRGEITGDPGDVSQDHKVWPMVYERLGFALFNEKRVVLDATNLNPKAWKPVLEYAEDHGVTPVAYVMRTDFKVASRRNKDRSRVVPQHVMERMWWDYTEWVRPKTLAQAGFEVVEIYEESDESPK